MTRGGGSRDEATAVRLLREQGLTPRGWANPPGDAYGRHEHSYHKVLYCVAGGVTFHTSAGNLSLEPGDRLDIEPGTEHAATVGPDGVRCVEGS